jgi:hypothetical protein
MQKVNIKKFIVTIIVLVGISISFTSCLKENTLPPLYGISTPNVIAFQDNGGPSGQGAGAGNTTSPFPLYQFAFDAATYVNNAATFNAIIIYGPNGTAPQDITVNLAFSQAALDSFNNVNSTSYVSPDPSIFSIPASVVIKKGTSQAYAPITLKNSASFDYSASYVLPIAITSASYGTVSSNFASELNLFVIKNKYDGAYSLDIMTTGWAAYGISDNMPGSYPGGMELVTTSANSVAFYNGTTGYGGLQPAFTAGNAAATGFGATTPMFTFDPTTNKLVSVVNSTAPDSRNRQLAINPAITTSRFDPATKTVYAAYLMTQSGRPTQYIYDTLVYTGSR